MGPPEPPLAPAAYLQNRTLHIQTNVHWALHLHNVSGSIGDDVDNYAATDRASYLQ